MAFVPCKVENRVADHHIRKPIGKRHLFNQTNLKVFRRQSSLKRSRKPADMFNSRRIRVHRKYFAPLAQKMHQVSPVPASGVEHAHAGRDVSSQDLIEHVNINLPELFLNGQRHFATVPAIGGFAWRSNFETTSARA